MKKYSSALFLMLALAFIAACASQQKPQQMPQPAPESEISQQETIPPASDISQQQKDEISPEVKELLDKHKSKITSIYYKYRGPQTGSNFYEFYVKDGKIKYMPYRETKSLDKPDSYDNIFIDKAAKTAQSYCEAAYCLSNGKKADLDYDEVYMPTIIDWIEGLTQVKKVGEEVVDDRSTWKLETSQGTLWVDNFYGVPLKIESGGKTFRFEQIAVNRLKDSDVNPAS